MISPVSNSLVPHDAHAPRAVLDSNHAFSFWTCSSLSGIVAS
jgi:hypothetical protein